MKSLLIEDESHLFSQGIAFDGSLYIVDIGIMRRYARFERRNILGGLSRYWVRNSVSIMKKEKIVIVSVSNGKTRWLVPYKICFIIIYADCSVKRESIFFMNGDSE